jgi:signal transduction histidine kinase
MAHEVRNALSPIKGAAQIMKSEMGKERLEAEWPDIIIAEVDGLTRLTSAMLDFARPIPLDLRTLAPADFLTACVNSIARFLAEHNVEIEWRLHPELPDIEADPVQLGQAVRNLVMNAAQSMPGGGVLSIFAEYDLSSKMLVMKFTDSGVGVPPEDAERIFRPFVTTKPKGTGLGLPIVSKIVSTHGGRVEVDTDREYGACFVVSLPLSPPEGGMDTSTDLPLISAESARFPDN